MKMKPTLYFNDHSSFDGDIWNQFHEPDFPLD